MGNRCNGSHQNLEAEENARLVAPRGPTKVRKQEKMGSAWHQGDKDLTDEERAAGHQPHHCTDALCCLLFLLALCGVGFIFQYAHGKADMRRISHGIDWSGQLCGVDKYVVDKPLLYWCAKSTETVALEAQAAAAAALLSGGAADALGNIGGQIGDAVGGLDTGNIRGQVGDAAGSIGGQIGNAVGNVDTGAIGDRLGDAAGTVGGHIGNAVGNVDTGAIGDHLGNAAGSAGEHIGNAAGAVGNHIGNWWGGGGDRRLEASGSAALGAGCRDATYTGPHDAEKLCQVGLACEGYKYGVALGQCQVLAAQPATPGLTLPGIDQGAAQDAAGAVVSGYLSASSKLDMTHPICVSKCPEVESTTHQCYQDMKELRSNPDPTGSYWKNTTYHFNYVQDYPSHPLADRYCIPQNTSSIAQLEGTLSWGVESLMFRLVQVKDSWQPVAASAVLALVLGYAYLLLAKNLAAPLLYCALAMAVIMPFGAGAWIIYGAFSTDVDAIFEKHLDQKIPELVSQYTFPSSGSKQVDLGIAAVLMILSFGISCVSCCLWRKIELVLATIEATIDCIWDVPAMLIQPLFMVAYRLAYVGAALYGFAYLLTLGRVRHAHLTGYMPTGVARSFDLSEVEQFYVASYVFVAIWAYEILRALDEFVFGYATQRWYFAEYNFLGQKKVSWLVFFRAYTLGLAYHLGTLAFGAFLLALFRLVEIIMSFIHDRVSDAAGDDEKKQALVKCCFCCCFCCLECWEKMVKFLNKNAYLVTAVESKNYCEASQTAFNIIMTEIAEVAVLQGATFIFQLGGLITITGAGIYLTWFLCLNVDQLSNPESEYYVSNPETVTGLAGLLSFTIALVFTFLFDVVSDSILFCYSLDKKRHEEEHTPMNTNLPSRLQSLLQHSWTQEESQKYKNKHRAGSVE